MPVAVDIPSLRKRIGELYRQGGRLLSQMLRPAVLLRGSVYELRTRCGKPSCCCRRQEERHRRWVLSESREGRTRLRVVPPSKTESWRRWAQNYREFRRRRADFVQLTQRILQDLDAIERAQRRDPDT
jgi:hypothetical protein